MMIGKSILVVDDEYGVRKMCAKALDATGCETYLAANGHEAIAILERAPIDLAIVDIFMPEKEGIETIMEIKARWPHVKAVAMSGGGRIGVGDILRIAQASGADGTLRKPLKFGEIVAVIASLLNVEAAWIRRVR